MDRKCSPKTREKEKTQNRFLGKGESEEKFKEKGDREIKEKRGGSKISPLQLGIWVFSTQDGIKVF